MAIAKKLARLAEPYAEECINTLVKIMRDDDSRQQRAATVDLLTLMQEGATDEKGQGGNTRVLIVNAPDIHRLGEMQRMALQAEKQGQGVR
jgi:hypothetical protein